MKKFTTLLITLMVLFSFCYSANAEEFTLRNGIAFGDSMEDVKSKETIAIDTIDDEFGENDAESDHPYSITTKEDTVAGISGSQIFYHFDKDKKLCEVVYFFASSSNKDIIDSNYETINSGLVRKYGSPLGNSNGKSHIITSSAINDAVLIYEIMKMVGGVGDMRDYDEWIVRCDNYNVKIDQVCYYAGSSYSDINYMHCLGYKYFTDEMLKDKQNEKKEQQETVDNDI